MYLYYVYTAMSCMEAIEKIKTQKGKLTFLPVSEACTNTFIFANKACILYIYKRGTGCMAH
jgi:hypothetical protein